MTGQEGLHLPTRPEAGHAHTWLVQSRTLFRGTRHQGSRMSPRSTAQPGAGGWPWETNSAIYTPAGTHS